MNNHDTRHDTIIVGLLLLLAIDELRLRVRRTHKRNEIRCPVDGD